MVRDQTILGIGNFRVNPRFYPMSVGWNLGLTREFSTPTILSCVCYAGMDVTPSTCDVTSDQRCCHRQNKLILSYEFTSNLHQTSTIVSIIHCRSKRPYYTLLVRFSPKFAHLSMLFILQLTHTTSSAGQMKNK